MFTKRAMVGVTGAALVGVALVTVPAIGAPGDAPRANAKQRIAAAPRAIGAFTPAAADPRLAATLARAGIGAGNFRFTPSEARRDGNRAISVAVRSSSGAGHADTTRIAVSAAPASVSMAPIAYNLGAAVGWKRFALSSDLTRVDLGAQPGSRESVDVGVSYVGPRASARVKAVADRPLRGTAPRMIEGAESYSLDVGGSYKLTRNLDVTAGMRYKSDRERIELRDERRDSKAVYVGTAFRF